MMNNQDYKAFFEQSSEMILVMDTHLHIVAASDEYLRITKTIRENIVGRYVFEIFPDNPNDISADGENKLRASFNQVIKTKTTQTISVIKYDIKKPASEGGGFEPKYWKTTQSPIFDANNNVKYIIQRVEDVTENQTLIEQLDFEKKALKLVEDSEKRYNLMLMKSPFAFAVLKGKDMVVTLANDSIKKMWRKGNDIEGKSMFEILPEIIDTPFPDLLNNVYTTGVPFYGDELPVQLHHDNKLEKVYFNFIYQPYLEADETISGITIIAYEVTGQVILKKALEAQHETEKKSLLKIKASEERFRLLIQQAPVAICVFRGKNFVTEIINKPMAEMWDRKPEEVLNKPVFDVLTEMREQGFKELLDNVYNSGERFVAQELPVNINRNGKLENAFVRFVYEPLQEADGTISGVMVVAHEITEQVLARKKIEENNKRNNMLMMESPFAFSIMKGKDLVVTLANDLTKEIWGKGKDVEGKTLIEILPEIIGQPFTDVMHKVLTTGIPVYLNEILTKLMHNGKLEERYFNIVYQPYHEPDATISGVTAIGYEVTETVLARIKIQESEERFRVLMNVMPQKITHADTSGNVVFFNQQWLDETGYTLEELKNGGWAKSLHPDELQEITENWLKSVETGHIFDMEIRVKNNEGDYKWHLSRAVPVIDETGKRIMWVGSNTDIHELKEAKSKAEEAVKAKQQFLSNMSHEIRTPMNAIVGFTHVVLKTDLNKAQKEYIKAIKVSGDALIVLINDILDLAQVDAGKMTFQQLPFNLSDSISAMLLVFEIKLKEKNIILIKNYDATIPKVLIGDPIRLRQIILNLLSNAVKFTEKGTITIGVHLLDEDSEKVTIEFNVTDTGIGIPENKLPHIFDNFEQAHTDTGKSFGGTGLGLAIFKQLVEHQGGSISVKTKEGEGSTFSFILPFKKTTNKMPVKPEPKIITSPEMIKAKVLVAEDVHLNRLLIKIILADLGFEVETADNGKIAIEKLKENNYDIVLMDLQMPEMDGFEATIYIRNTMRSQIPIIALTADVTATDVEKSKVVGMNDYISKPIDEKLLYSKIIEQLGHK